MLRLLLLSGLALLVLAHKDDDDDDHRGSLGSRIFGEGIDPRLAANAIRIIGLEKKLGKLKDKLHEAEKIDPQSFINNLLARVNDLEGTHCDDHAFQCGGHEQECVSDLLVCDDHKDCHNGHDEDKDVCSAAPVEAGHIYSGVSVWSGCLNRADHVTRIVITQTSRRVFFRPRIWVRAHIESDLEENGKNFTSEFHAKGFYNFANRHLVLVPVYDEDHHHLSVVCNFNYGDDERATCNRVLESTRLECAHLDVHQDGH